MEEILNQYYYLKNQYENNYYEQYLKKIKSLNKREKKIAKSKLPKPKCINCERNVGTIFNIKYDKEQDFRLFSVSCGDLENPCSLNIKFQLDTIYLFSRWFKEATIDINYLKKIIINDKNNVLFNYINQKELLDNFDDYNKELKELTNIYGFNYEKFILINENPKKKLEYIELMKNLGLRLQEFKELVNEYKLGNSLNLTNATNLYIHEIMPLLKNIREIKYNINNVEFDEKKQTYNLIQIVHSIDKLQNKLNENNLIISNVFGEIKKVKTKKIRKTSELTKTKKTKQN